MACRDSWFCLLPLVLLAGCAGGAGNGLGGDPVTITLQGQFEKRALDPAGFSSNLSIEPTRHAYAEIIEDATGGILVAGYLDAMGRGLATIPSDAVVHAAIYADYQVPNAPEDAGFFQNGSVKRASPAPSYADAQTFNRLPEWGVSSDSFAVTQGGTLTLTALESTREAGAFNIADQGVAFASALRGLDPALRLPDLHAFWDPNAPATPATYPEVVADAHGQVLHQTPGMGARAVFQVQIRLRSVPGSVVGDGYADGELQERYAHLLFADYGASDSGSPFLRRDNDLVAVDRGYPSESTVAFVDGYCDFLSAAFRNASAITLLDASGAPSTFHLDDPTYPRIGATGEFHRGSVAIGLRESWTQALGGGDSGLRRLWQATQATTPGAYLNAPLGCYPTYLAGLKELLGPASAAWLNIASRLAADVTAPAYLNGPALWSIPPALPFTANGTLRTYASTYYYDRDQAQAYRFTRPAGGPLDLQLVPTSGQDFFLELIGPTGVLAASTNLLPAPGARVLSLSHVPAGDYVARVRVGYTTANNPAAGYTLTVF
jgi:hypothetical protein